MNFEKIYNMILDVVSLNHPNIESVQNKNIE